MNFILTICAGVYALAFVLFVIGMLEPTKYLIGITLLQSMFLFIVLMIKERE